MAEMKPTPDWLDDLAAVTAQHDKTPSANQGVLAKALKLHRPYVSQLLVLQPIFDPPTVEKVRQASPAYNLSYRRAKELLGLKGKVADFPKAGREMVDQILTRHLATNQIKDLVDEIVRENPTRGTAGSSNPAFFERLGRRIDRALGWGGSPLEADSQGGQPDAEESEGEEPAKAKTPKTSAKAPAQGKAPSGKKAGGPVKWAGKQIEKTPTNFANHPGTFMKNLVLGTLQFVFWGILLCVLIGFLHWGWVHYGRSFVGGKVKELMPSVSAKADNAQASSTPTPSAAPVAQAGTPAKTHSPRGYREIQPPEELNDRVKKSKDFATDFVKHLCKLANQDFDYVREYFNGNLSTDYSDDFYKEYFSPEKRKEYEAEKEFQVFEPDNPPKLLRFDDYADDILVQGELTTRSDSNPDYPHKVLSRKRVGLVLTVSHSGGDPFVSGIKEVAPEPIH